MTHAFIHTCLSNLQHIRKIWRVIFSHHFLYMHASDFDDRNRTTPLTQYFDSINVIRSSYSTIMHIILYICHIYIILLSLPLSFISAAQNEKDRFISLQLLITHRILAFPSRKQDPNLLCIGNHILLGNHCDRLHCYQQLHQ